MKNFKGFTVIEGLLILIIVGILGGTGWYVYDVHNKTTDTLVNADEANSSVAKYKKKPVEDKAKLPSTKQCTDMANWTAVSSEKGKFSFCYPASWKMPSHPEACNSDLFDRAVFLGPDEDSVLKCATEYFGQIGVGSLEGDKRVDYALGSGYKDVVEKATSINGVTGKRISATAYGQDNGPGSYLDGTLIIRYVFYTQGVTYTATYVQAPAGHAPSQNVLNDFDVMISQTLKFSS